MSKRKKTGLETALEREARASCSLDGETRCCEACEQEARECIEAVHTCGQRPMTEAERRVLAAARAWRARKNKATEVEMYNAVVAMEAERGT